MKENYSKMNNFDIYVFEIFDHYCHKIISGGATGQEIVFASSFEIFVLLSNFLKSQALSLSASHETALRKSFLLLVLTPVLLVVNLSCNEKQ